MSGHTSEMTSIHYLRRSIKKGHRQGKMMTEKITGEEVVEADFETVLLNNGLRVLPRRFTPPVLGMSLVLLSNMSSIASCMF